MTPADLERLVEAKAARRAVAHCTWLRTGEQIVMERDDAAPDALADALAVRFRSGRSGIEAVEGDEVFVRVHVPSPRLVAIGAVHISQALARIAALAEFDVLVVDPRTAFATPERFDGVRLVAEWPEREILRLDPYTALAALTHDPKIDDEPLAWALEAGCFYVGALGSRKTHEKRLTRLRERGVDQGTLDRVHAPIGLDIGAASPQEIAVAVMAEVIATLRR